MISTLNDKCEKFLNLTITSENSSLIFCNNKQLEVILDHLLKIQNFK